MSTAPNYGSLSYWDERYSAEDGKSFDWYQDYSTLKPALQTHLKRHIPDFEILIPGCGNSSLASELYADGFTNITSVDISSVVIHQMTDRHSAHEDMEFTHADARSLEFVPANSFDLIIDKGLFDCQLCTSDNLASVQSLVAEMFRVLKPGGVYVIVSHGPPESRMGYLTRGSRWAVDSAALPKPLVEGLEEEGNNKNHFIYSCKKLSL